MDEGFSDRLHYLLDGCEVVPLRCDLLTWARWFEHADRRVAEDYIGEAYISTVFLGIDHGFGSAPGHEPILFETMVFMADGYFEDLIMDRCSTYDEALAMHERACETVRQAWINLPVTTKSR